MNTRQRTTGNEIQNKQCKKRVRSNKMDTVEDVIEQRTHAIAIGFCHRWPGHDTMPPQT